LKNIDFFEKDFDIRHSLTDNGLKGFVEDLNNLIKKMNVKYSQNPSLEAGKFLNENFIERGGKPLLLLLSGGSALGILRHFKVDKWAKYTTLGVCDERFDVREDVNNFSQLKKTEFFNEAVSYGAKYIDTSVKENDNLYDFSERYRISIEKWREENPNGDIVTILGMGADGHTAGIMPFPENPDLFNKLFEDYSFSIVGYDAGEKSEHPLRITVNNTFLREVNLSVVYVAGDEKKEAFNKLLDKEEGIPEIPARIFYQMKNTSIFTNIGII